MGLSKAEKETIIRFDASSNKALLWSADPVWQRKIKNMKGAKKCFDGTYEIYLDKRRIKIEKER